jgi:hypothetical protein
MSCQYPVVLGKDRIVGCGQCTNCRIRKKKEWTSRIVLESTLYEDNTFVTLSYDEDHLPEDASVSKRELQLFMKRLRKVTDGERQIRYFGVGEYGDRTCRPHYHVILFNHLTCLRGISRYTKRDTRCCPVCSSVRSIWARGQVYLGEVSVSSAAYVSSYTIKGWTKETEVPEFLNPEFTAKSRGIGHDYAWELASNLLETGHPCVPFSVRHNGRLWPLGRYMREKVSEYAGGLPLEKAPEDQKLSAMSEAIYSDVKIPSFRKAPALREAVIQTRYHKAEAIKRRIQKQRKDRLI